MKFKYIYGTICILKIERSIKMPDSEELNEILKEIKNINAPKEEKPKKPEAPLSFAKQGQRRLNLNSNRKLRKSLKRKA